MSRLIRASVRVAVPRDAADLNRIEQLAWTPSTHPYAGHRLQGFGSRFDFDGTFVAQVRDEVIGYASVGRAGPGGAQAHVWRLHSIAMRAEHRHQGLGRELLTAAESHAQAAGALKVKLRVLSTNLNALAFYERCGYRVEARLIDEFQVDGRFVDELTMARRIA
ncbi:GNAT family N-acetyltransferase [soil metagenome]